MRLHKHKETKRRFLKTPLISEGTTQTKRPPPRVLEVTPRTMNFCIIRQQLLATYSTVRHWFLFKFLLMLRSISFPPTVSSVSANSQKKKYDQDSRSRLLPACIPAYDNTAHDGVHHHPPAGPIVHGRYRHSWNGVGAKEDGGWNHLAESFPKTYVSFGMVLALTWLSSNRAWKNRPMGASWCEIHRRRILSVVRHTRSMYKRRRMVWHDKQKLDATSFFFLYYFLFFPPTTCRTT